MTMNADSMTLYRHTRRPNWGLAILVSESSTKRTFQFQDGTRRTIHQRFAELIAQVDKPLDEAAEITESLVSEARIVMAREERRQSGRDSGPQISFKDQLTVFLHLYPEGFASEAWQLDVRGEGAKSKRKRHRVRVLTKAQELLAPQILTRLVEGEQWNEVTEAAIEVLAATDLVSPSKDMGPLVEMPPEGPRAFALAPRDLLDGHGDVSARFDAFLRSFLVSGRQASWALSTTLPGVCRPDKLTCVRPSAFRTQARWMAPRLAISAEPTAHCYSRLLSMVITLKARLESDGQVPADLLDVYDFIWVTLRPKALKLLKEIR